MINNTKPICAVALGKNTLKSIIPSDVKEEMVNTVLREGRLAYVPIEAATDGRTAFVRYNPDNEISYVE